MSAYVSHTERIDELPELEYRLLQALRIAGGPRSAEELADTIGRQLTHVQTTVVRLAAAGRAHHTTAWALTRTGRRALQDPGFRRRLTQRQQQLLCALETADGARSIAELAETVGTHAEVTATMQSLHESTRVRPVEAWMPTSHTHRAWNGIMHDQQPGSPVRPANSPGTGKKGRRR